MESEYYTNCKNVFRLIQAELLQGVEDVLDVGLVGSVNDNECIEGWSDLDVLILLKCDESGSIAPSVLSSLNKLHILFQSKYKWVRISFLPHTKDDFYNYVSVRYLLYYSFCKSRHGLISEVCKDVISKKKLSEDTIRNYVLYHYRHLRFNTIRKVIEFDNHDPAGVKVLVDAIIDASIDLAYIHGKLTPSKAKRVAICREIGIPENIVEILEEAVMTRANWVGFKATSQNNLYSWILKFQNFIAYLTGAHRGSTTEEFIGEKKS